MQMYVDDNRDTFPGMASEHSGFQASDWIYWRTNDTAHPVQQSPIVITLANANTNLFRCPMDTDNSARIAQAASDSANGPYLYSYSLTSYNLTRTVDTSGNSHDANPGMSSVLRGGRKSSRSRWPPFAIPGGKIMLAEEPGSNSNSDNPTGAAVINDGRWMPQDADPLTARHGGKGDVTFADFHVEPETYGVWGRHHQFRTGFVK